MKMERECKIYDRAFILTNESPENFRKSRPHSTKKLCDVRVSSEGRPSHFQKNSRKQNDRLIQKRGKLFASPLLSAKNCNTNVPTEDDDGGGRPKMSALKLSTRSNLSKAKSFDHLDQNLDGFDPYLMGRSRKIQRRSSSVPGSPKDESVHNFPMKVFIRIKPLNPSPDDHRVLFREDKTFLNLHLPAQKYCFKFEEIFDDGNEDPTECQKIVYERTIRNSIKNILDGFNCCLMAYGPTGSGKTYSMIGTPSRPGIIHRFCADLIENLNDRCSDDSFVIRIAYYEIYNEKIFDLLNSKDEDKILKVRENPQTGPYVEGLKLHDVKSFDEIDILLKRGNNRRTKAATLKNDQSSRSHAIFSVKLYRNTHADGFGSSTHSSSVCFVDLAGSEKIAAVVDSRETTTINKSLCFLSKVILQLGNRKRQHVSYRDSILTWLLKDYLGSNAHTHMLVTVRASEDSIEETLNTLRFASRAKAVICRVAKEEIHPLKGYPNQLEKRQRSTSIGSLVISSKATECATQTESLNDPVCNKGVPTDWPCHDLQSLESKKSFLIKIGIITVSVLELQINQFYVVLLTTAGIKSIDKLTFLLERQKSLTFGSNRFVDVQIDSLPPFCCKLSRDSKDDVSLTWLTAIGSNCHNRGDLTHTFELDPAINGLGLVETHNRSILRSKDCVRLNGENFILLWMPQSNDDFINYYMELESAKLNCVQNESLKSIADLQSKINSLQEQLDFLENRKTESDCFECEVSRNDVETRYDAGDGTPSYSRSVSSVGTSLSFSSDLVDAVNRLKDHYEQNQSVKSASRRFSSLFVPRLVKEANEILASFNKQHFEFSHDRILDENTRQYIQSIRLVNSKLKVYTTLSVETFKLRLESVRCLYEVGDVTGDKIEEKLMSSRDVWRQLYQDDSNLYSLAL